MTPERPRSPFESTRSRVIVVALLAGAITQLILSASAADPPPGAGSPGTKLEPEKPIERAIGPGDTHAFEVEVPKGHVVSGVVNQKGIDVKIRVLDPKGALVATIDSPNGAHGPEPWTAGKKNHPEGAWRIEVIPFASDTKPGRYEASIAETITQRALAERRAKRAYQSPRLQKLWAEHEDGGAAAIDRFVNEIKGHAPLVEPIQDDARGDSLVTFAWRGQPEDGYIAVVGPSFEATIENPMRRFEGTDLMFLTVRLPSDSRFTYSFLQGAPLVGMTAQQARELRPRPQPDTWNPRDYFGGSLVELPQAPAQPYLQRADGAPQGRLVETSIPSAVLKEDRKLGVYLPPGFDPSKGPYPYVIVFDGEDSGLPSGSPLIPVPTILDNLIAQGKVPPMLAVLVDTLGQRERDLAMSPPFGEFLANELAPWLRREYKASADPAKATLAGVSLGGLSALYNTFHHADVFGNALSHSASLWFTPGARQVAALHHLEPGALLREVRDAPKKPVRIWMEVGLFEGSSGLLGAGMLPQNRHMRDVLLAKGYAVTYREYSGGHDFISWRGSFADGLITLAGSAPRP